MTVYTIKHGTVLEGRQDNQSNQNGAYGKKTSTDLPNNNDGRQKVKISCIPRKIVNVYLFKLVVFMSLGSIFDLLSSYFRDISHLMLFRISVEIGQLQLKDCNVILYES